MPAVPHNILSFFVPRPIKSGFRFILYRVHIVRFTTGADRFFSCAFIDFAAIIALVFYPFEFLDIQIQGAANRTHPNHPHKRDNKITIKTFFFSGIRSALFLEQ
jgi:hypothetical protein